MADGSKPILHVIVVGFHHKKGCQVEYSFPPLVPGALNECPLGWKYLPTLALPDGSHNYDNDTVYFHLPSLTDPRQTIFGVSCFKQIAVEKLINRTSDITRGTVQKSVCILSRMPLYGYIQVKMALITHAYFDEGDFSKVSLLEETYHHLNTCMSTDSQMPPQVFIGLSARDFILQFRHKALLLFKLILLEKRVLFFQSPVYPLCSAILTLLSLFPGMIETGLDQAACIRPSRPMSPMPNFEEEHHAQKPSKTLQSYKSAPRSEVEVEKKSDENINTQNDNLVNQASGGENSEDNIENYEEEMRNLEVSSTGSAEASNYNSKSNLDSQTENTDALNTNFSEGSDCSPETLSDDRITNCMTHIANIDADLCGMPLNIFSKGYLCLPYLSLPYMDLLGDDNVRGYIVGATNVLFKQKKQLIDVLIETETARIEANDSELRKQLHLTTEDLRFADYIVRQVADPKRDSFFDGVGWEGGDEWIRTQFRVYLLCLLRTSLQDDTRQLDHFNSSFMNAWKLTNNYKAWSESNNSEIMSLDSGHPFAGQLSVQDMKLRFSHTMQNTEGGRKLNQAMASTGRAVATTGKAVGGALSQAKGAFSNWWSTLTTPQPLEADQRSEDNENSQELIDRETHNVNEDSQGKLVFS